MIRRAFFFISTIALANPLYSQQIAAPDSLNLTLKDAVTKSLQNGDEARIAAAQTNVTDAQVDIARAAVLPQVRLTGSQVHQLESARAQAVGSIFFQPLTYNATAALTQPVFQGGKLSAGIRAASALRRAARLNESEVRSEVVVDVQRAYLQALFSRQFREIQQSSYDLAAARVKQAEQFQAAGRVARYDVLRARVELANIEPTLIQARNDERIALLELKRLINVPANQPVNLATPIDSAAISFALASIDTSGINLRNRAAVRSAELNADARRAGVAAARADYLPSLAFNASLGRQAFPESGFPTKAGRVETVPCPTADNPSKTCAEQNGGWFGDRSVGFSVSWPILDIFRIRGAVDQARAQLQIARLEASQTRENVSNEIATAFAELERAQSAYEARRESVKEAEEAFSLASLRFSRGISTQLEVSDAQLALTTARTNSARATYDLYLAVVDLAHAQGKPLPLPDGSKIDPNVSTH